MQDHNTAETSRVHLRSVALHRQLHQRDCFNCAAATINTQHPPAIARG